MLKLTVTWFPRDLAETGKGRASYYALMRAAKKLENKSPNHGDMFPIYELDGKQIGQVMFEESN